MPKLNQVVAIEKAIKEKVNKQTAPLFHTSKQPAFFVGITKTYEPLNADGERLPDDSTRLQNTVPEILEAFAAPVAKMLDTQLTKETANTEAFADVVLDGAVLIEHAPVSFLLQFEKLLSQEVRGLILSLPTLDPAQEWQDASAERAGVFSTGVVQRHRTKKVEKPIVLYDATDKHPAQTQMITTDDLVGYWHERRFSGAISGQRKQELLDRVDNLIAAVKFAREAANNRDVDNKTIGAEVFGYLFG